MDDQEDDVIVVTGRPVRNTETKLQEKFVEAIAEQGALLDKLAQQLITLSLAIPGLYATALKLTQGEAATVPSSRWLYATYLFWAVALGVALIALIPRDYNVDPMMLKPDPKGKSQKLSLEEFFYRNAVYKRRLLIVSAVCLFGGIASAAFLIL